MDKVSVLIPAYRVADSIVETVEAVVSSGRADEIIVVDDCCPEGSGKLAERRGVRVVSLDTNRGKGGALTEAYKASSGDIIVLLDGDLGKSASEYGKLVQPIIEGKADMTIARFRPATRKGGFGFAKGLAKATVKFHAGLDVESPMSGQRAMRRQVVDALGRFESGWAIETAMTIDVVRMGYKVAEVPTDMTHAETGRDIEGFRHRFQQFRAVFRVLVSRLFYRRRRAV